MGNGDNSSLGIRSLEKGALLLQALRQADGPMRLVDLATNAGMTASAARGYMVSLVRTGLAVQNMDTGLYDLGEAALQLGLSALRRVDFLPLAQKTLAELAASTNQTAVLSVWSDRGPMVIAKIEGRNDSFYEVRIGTVVTLLPTATGRIFMAYLPPSSWEALLPKEQSCPEIEGVLAGIRSDGMAATMPATLPDAVSLAAPIFDHQDILKGVITVIGRAQNLDTRLDGQTARTLREATLSLSRRLGAG